MSMTNQLKCLKLYMKMPQYHVIDQIPQAHNHYSTFEAPKQKYKFF